MSPVLVTGSAGFIGYHVCEYLLKRQETVIGIDNLNDYYDPNLKKARLKKLQTHKNFHFVELDLSDRKAVSQFADKHPNIERIVHLAAQAGVRYSLENPFAYTDANIQGHLAILEACRKLPVKHLVYASSSSVYGMNEKLPFSVEDPVDTPMSLYAVTKRSCELMSFCYSHLFQIPSTGLRFFTVYGPWGRPDMSAFIFTRAILENQENPVFNYGDMRRNFTYIDDIVQGTIACLDTPPAPEAAQHRLYNLGNDRAESLMDFIHTLEKIIGKKAHINLMPIQPGDVKETIADITKTTQDFGFQPKTNIDEGLTHFVHWYREFYGI